MACTGMAAMLRRNGLVRGIAMIGTMRGIGYAVAPRVAGSAAIAQDNMCASVSCRGYIESSGPRIHRIVGLGPLRPGILFLAAGAAQYIT